MVTSFNEKQIEPIALAVYSPIPGKDMICSKVFGNIPSYSSIIIIAAFFKFLALA